MKNTLPITKIIGGILLLNLIIGGAWFFGNGQNKLQDKESVKVYFAQGEYQKFIDHTNDDTGKYGDLVYWRAVSYLKLGQFDKALSSVVSSYTVLKSNLNVALMKGIGLRQKKDYESAELALKKMSSPNVFEQSAITLMRGINFYHRGNKGNAKKLLNDSITFDPISPIAYYYLGRLALDAANPALAVTHFATAEKQGLVSSELDLLRSQALLDTGSVSESQELFDIVDQTDISDLALYLMTQARLAEAQEDVDGAISAYQNILDIEPDNISLYTKLGELYIKGDDLAKAIYVFGQGYALDETNTKLLVDQYVTLAQTDATQEVLSSIYDTLFELLGVNQSQYEYFLQQLYKSDLIDQTGLVFERLFTINPENKVGKRIQKNILNKNILGAYRTNGDLVPLFDQAQELYSGDTLFTHLEAMIQANAGDIDIALQTLDSLSPDDEKLPAVSSILRMQVTHALLEGSDNTPGLAQQYIDAVQQEYAQTVAKHVAAEASLDDVDLERDLYESPEDFAFRVELAQKAAREAWEASTPPIKDNFDIEKLMMDRLVIGFLKAERNTQIQDQLTQIDFRFASDEYMYSQAHALLQPSYKRLLPYYTHVDTLFVSPQAANE